MKPLVLVLCLAALGSCARPLQPVPQCLRFQFSAAVRVDTGERFLVIDEVNTLRLNNLIKGLAEGTCSLPDDVVRM